MATEEKLLVAPAGPEALFNLVRENHNLREASVLLRGEIVALKEKLAAARRQMACMVYPTVEAYESMNTPEEDKAARRRLGLGDDRKIRLTN